MLRPNFGAVSVAGFLVLAGCSAPSESNQEQTNPLQNVIEGADDHAYEHQGHDGNHGLDHSTSPAIVVPEPASPHEPPEWDYPDSSTWDSHNIDPSFQDDYLGFPSFEDIPPEIRPYLSGVDFSFFQRIVFDETATDFTMLEVNFLAQNLNCQLLQEAFDQHRGLIYSNVPQEAHLQIDALSNALFGFEGLVDLRLSSQEIVDSYASVILPEEVQRELDALAARDIKFRITGRCSSETVNVLNQSGPGREL